MPKKQSKVVASSSDENENVEMDDEYDSEDNSASLQSGNIAMMREVNKDNVLNYETDSDDDFEGQDSEELGQKMQAQKEALRMNDTWGKNKKSYYQASSEEDESEAEEQDQLNEARRLQEIRSRKLAKQFKAQHNEQESDESDDQPDKQDVGSDDDSSDNQENEGHKKLGDQLFDSDYEAGQNKEETKQAAELNLLDPEIVQ